MHDWMDGRANPVPEREDSYANGMLTAVERYFGVSWLADAGLNPIQVLWKRKDGFATSELMILGAALQIMGKDHPQWVKRRVQAAKSRKADIRIGDLFELVGLSKFCCHRQTVSAAREGQPGYDGTITLHNGAVIYVSMKNFAATTHELHFLRRSASIKTRFAAELQRRNLTGLSLIAFASTYPQEVDWKNLEDSIPILLIQTRSEVLSTGNWIVKIGGVPDGKGQIVADPLSYQISIFSPYHPNEKQNLLSRLAEAAANFEKHASQYSEPKSYRLLYIRLHESAPVNACTIWCREYLDDNPGTPIDKIVLYQPAIVQFNPQDETGIAHHVALLDRQEGRSFMGTDGTEEKLRMETIIGRPATKPSSLELAGLNVKLPDTYAYQNGNIYRSATINDDGSTTGYMKVLAPGIIQHSVVLIDGFPMLVSGKYQTSDELLLFT